MERFIARKKKKLFGGNKGDHISLSSAPNTLKRCPPQLHHHLVTACTLLFRRALPASLNHILAKGHIWRCEHDSWREWGVNIEEVTSVTIPTSVTSIGGGGCAFEGCSALTSVDIPASITSIRQYAFARCDSLTMMLVQPGDADDALKSYACALAIRLSRNANVKR